ncbi:MAG TPA: asparagine synthase-related protein, partial [Emticicia sp.]
NQYQKAWHYLLFLKKNDNLSLLTAVRRLIIDPAIPEGLYLLLRKYLRPDSIRLNDNLLAAANKKRIFGVGGSAKERFSNIIDSGIVGGLLFNTQKKLSASFGLECTDPMLDKSICEFFMDIPPEQFLLNNSKRSLMRRAMQDYVPEEIQWRKDKSAFSPNFAEKFIESKAYITHILTDDAYRNARKYINIDAFKSDCDRLFLGYGNSTRRREAAFVIMLITFLFWLENKNYSI